MNCYFSGFLGMHFLVNFNSCRPHHSSCSVDCFVVINLVLIYFPPYSLLQITSFWICRVLLNCSASPPHKLIQAAELKGGGQLAVVAEIEGGGEVAETTQGVPKNVALKSFKTHTFANSKKITFTCLHYFTFALSRMHCVCEHIKISNNTRICDHADVYTHMCTFIQHTI